MKHETLNTLSKCSFRCQHSKSKEHDQFHFEVLQYYQLTTRYVYPTVTPMRAQHQNKNKNGVYTNGPMGQSCLHMRTDFNRQITLPVKCAHSCLALDDPVSLCQLLGNLLVLMLQQRQRISRIVPLSLVDAPTKSGREFLGEVLCMFVL